MKAKNQVVAIIVAFVVSTFFLIIIASIWSAAENKEYIPNADYGVVIDSMDVEVEWREDRSCHISQSMAVTFEDDNDGYGSHGIYIDIPVNSGEKIRGLTVSARGNYTFAGKNRIMPYNIEHQNGFKIVRIVVGDEDDVFYKHDTMTCKIEYDYITPVHPDNKNLLDINAIGYGWVHPILNATVTVTYPTELGTGFIATSGARDKATNVPSDGITVSGDKRTVTVRTALAPFNGVRVRMEMPDGMLTEYYDFTEYIPIIIGAVLLVVIVLAMLLLGRDKHITPIVDFYPPRVNGKDGRKRHMLPVQMGKIIDGSCSVEDVTSLIFYWASKGYLDIEEKDGHTYFIKKNDVDEVTEYEKRMFDALFANKKERNDGSVRVSLDSLKGRFAGYISQVKTGVDTEYKGKLYKIGFNALAVIAWIITFVYGICIGFLCTFKVSMRFFNFPGLLIVIPVILAGIFGSSLATHYIKLSAHKRRAGVSMLFILTIVVSAAIMFVVPAYVMDWASKAVFAFCIGVCAALSPFLTKRTDEYTEMLNEIVGFRDFLRDAEKDRLESLIHDDPQYYYNILPYANVLGVSDIWAAKFEGLAIEPPSYYYGHHGTVFDVIVIHNLSRSVGRSLSYVPPSSSGSHSGGHSSGGGGGGGSFGGFGGGGGGRW